MNKINAMDRRSMLKFSLQGAAASALGSLLPISAQPESPGVIRQLARNGKIVVVGAGAFGGWTALHLLRKGYNVTLVDQFGPGNSQASSGGETRLIRAFYGAQQLYFDMALRALEIWKENEPMMGRKILYQNGLAVFVPAATDADVEAALPMYKKAGLHFEKVGAADAARRWPQVKTSDLDHVMFDPIAGFLKARQGCEAVRDLFVKEGGTFIQQQVKQESIKSGKATHVTLSDGRVVEADSFVFACGPWLVRLFPGITKRLSVTRQVSFFFASPTGGSDLMENKMPTWFNKTNDGTVDAYGVPGCEYRGFKIAFELTDIITHKFDTYNRYATPQEQDQAQRLLISRFPKMMGRPLIEQRICQYTETPDRNFILDKHPEADNLWILGGGSGHGYKMGASFGEMAANTVAGEKAVLKTFSLDRLLN